MGGCGDRRGRGGRSRGGRSRGGRSRGGRSRGGREGREGRKDGISRRIVRENGSGSASALFCRPAIPGLLPVVSFSNSSTSHSRTASRRLLLKLLDKPVHRLFSPRDLTTLLTRRRGSAFFRDFFSTVFLCVVYVKHQKKTEVILFFKMCDRCWR